MSGQSPVRTEYDSRGNAGGFKAIKESNEFIKRVDGADVEIFAMHFGHKALVVHQAKALIAAGNAVNAVASLFLAILQPAEDLAEEGGVSLGKVIHIVAVIQDLANVQHGNGGRGAGGIQGQPCSQLIVAAGVIVHGDSGMLLHKLA